MRQRSDETCGRFVLLPEHSFAYCAVGRLKEPAPPIVTLFGPAGVGKSHLVCQTIGEFLHHETSCQLIHLTGAELTAEFTKASHASAVPELQESLRRSDLFVCEDIHSLEGRRESQQQLLAILDDVTAKGGRVLLTCRKSPGDLRKFSSKFRSRCLGGICAEMPLLEVQSRKKLIAHFASMNGMCLDDSHCEFIADAMAVSSRELRGIVTQLQAVARNKHKLIDRDAILEVVHESTQKEKPSISQIAKLVASEFDVTVSALRATGRVQAIVLPRQIAMFAAHEWGKRPYADVGHYFGHRSHSTIVHACHRVRERLDRDTALRQQVDGLRSRLKTQ
ncbi:MAG: ATP-binding protein [Planctomycetaceae bacterium]|nr:ATP-binding protein [Planctomycetaceae bacterium]